MSENLISAPKVLSIQSHVVYGYVGNRAAVFPLQYLGFDVSFINSVQFSNHTHYPAFKGQILGEEELRDLVNGLVSNGLTHYNYLVTGYCRSVSFLHEIKKAVELLRRNNPNLKYVCDPVLGDQGRFYCPKELADLFRNEILPLADIITPNQFEIEVLTNRKISTETDVMRCLNDCHKLGVKIVVLSSCQFEDNDTLTSYVSYGESNQRFKVSYPAIPKQFTGSGDFFTSMLVAYIHRYPDDMASALENAVSVCQDILALTVEYEENINQLQATKPGSEYAGMKPQALASASIELKLVEGRHLLESNNPKFKAVPVMCSQFI